MENYELWINFEEMFDQQQCRTNVLRTTWLSQEFKELRRRKRRNEKKKQEKERKKMEKLENETR